jgi:hypothetical protein
VSQLRSKSRYRAALITAADAFIEQLESRQLMSVTASFLRGPDTTPGAQWSYAVNNGQGQTGTFVQQVVGPATVNGTSATEIDDGVNLGSLTTKAYFGTDGSGDLVNYQQVATPQAGVTSTDTYSPYEVSLPASMAPGVNYTFTCTDTNTSTGSPDTTTTITDVYTLSPNSPTDVIVPAGKYSAYEVTDIQTSTSDNATDTSTTTYYFSPGVGMVEALLPGGGSYQLTQFRNVNGMLAFRQNPDDSAAGGTIAPPVTVVAENTDGSTKTDETGSITLSLNKVQGKGKLSGTVTEPLVNGVATFSDLSVNLAGTYSLSATESGSATISPTTSFNFNVAPGKLVFKPAPTAGVAGDPISPTVQVDVVDGAGKLITTEDGLTVNLTPIGVSAGSAISGASAVISGGVASFPHLKFPKPGYYVLQAADGVDAQATTSKFKIGGDHLVFLKQPADSDVGQGIPLTLAIENASGKVDTLATSSVVLSLTPQDSSSTGTLGGTITLPFVKGVATFTTKAGPTITSSGNYTLTATDETSVSGILAPSNLAKSITSNPISISGYKLVISSEPQDSDVNTPIPLTVELRDSKNKLVTNENGARVEIVGAAVSGALPTATAITAFGRFKHGKAVFTKTTGPTVTGYGTFVLRAIEIGTSSFGVSTASTKVAKSRNVKITGYQLKFVKTPTAVDAALPDVTANASYINYPEVAFGMTIEAVDSKGALAPSTAIPGELRFEVSGYSKNQVTPFKIISSNRVGNHFAIRAAMLTVGTFTITAVGYDKGALNAAVQSAETEPGTLSSLNVSGYHIGKVTIGLSTTVTSKGTSFAANTPLSVRGQILDDSNERVYAMGINAPSESATPPYPDGVFAEAQLIDASDGSDVGSPVYADISQGAFDTFRTPTIIGKKGKYEFRITEVDDHLKPYTTTQVFITAPFTIK